MKEGHGMASRRIYESSSGDTWDIVRDDETGRISEVHTANLASGGAVADFDIDTFLPRSKGSAEFVELVKLIGTLVDE